MNKYIDNTLESFYFFGKFKEANELLLSNYTIITQPFLFLGFYINSLQLESFLDLYQSLDQKILSFKEQLILKLYFGYYLYFKGQFSDSLSLTHQIFSLLKKNDQEIDLEREFYYKLYFLQSHIFYRTGKLKLGLKILNKIQKSFKPLPEIVNIGIAHSKGNIHHELGNQALALKFHTKAYKYYQKTGNEYKLAGTYNNLAKVLHVQGKLEEAISYYDFAIELHRKFHHVENLVLNLNNKALVLYAQGKILEAIEIALETLQINKDLKSPYLYGFSNFILGICHFSLGNYEEAQTYYSTALPNWIKTDNPFLIASCVYYMIKLNLRLNKVVEEGEEPLVYYPARPFPTKVVSMIYNLIEAEIKIHEGNFFEAKKLLQKIIKSKGLEFGFRIQAHENLISIYYYEYLEDTDDVNKLKNVLKQLESWGNFCKNKNINPGLCKVYLVRAQLYLSLLQIEEANKEILTSIDIAENHHLPYHKRLAQIELNKISKLNSQMDTIKIKDLKLDQYAKSNFWSYLQEIERLLNNQE